MPREMLFKKILVEKVKDQQWKNQKKHGMELKESKIAERGNLILTCCPHDSKGFSRLRKKRYKFFALPFTLAFIHAIVINMN